MSPYARMSGGIDSGGGLAVSSLTTLAVSAASLTGAHGDSGAPAALSPSLAGARGGRGSRSAIRAASEREKALKARKMALSKAQQAALRDAHKRDIAEREAWHAAQRAAVRRRHRIE